MTFILGCDYPDCSARLKSQTPFDPKAIVHGSNLSDSFWRVQIGDRTFWVCDAHATPVLELLGQLKKTPAASPEGSGG